MREGRTPNQERGISPTAPGLGLPKEGGKSNPKLNQKESFIKCSECRGIFSPAEMYNQILCKDCADKIVVCNGCGKEFFPEKTGSKLCYKCENPDPEPKICKECGKEFIPKKSYYHTCPKCINF